MAFLLHNWLDMGGVVCMLRILLVEQNVSLANWQVKGLKLEDFVKRSINSPHATMSFYSNTIIQLMTLLLVVANTSVVYCLMIFCRILYFNGIRLTGRITVTGSVFAFRLHCLKGKSLTNQVSCIILISSLIHTDTIYLLTTLCFLKI